MVYHIGSIRDGSAKLYSQKKLHWSEGKINVLGVWLNKDLATLAKLNYQGILEETVKLCQVWQERGLTLAGKILIINLLIASKFAYKMSGLGLISDEILQAYNAVVYKFLWKGKRAKGPLYILQGNKEDGGLVLTNLKLRDYSPR